MECIIQAKTHAVTCSSVTGGHSLTFSYRNLGNFRGFLTAETVSRAKKVDSGWAHRWPFLCSVAETFFLFSFLSFFTIKQPDFEFRNNVGVLRQRRYYKISVHYKIPVLNNFMNKLLKVKSRNCKSAYSAGNVLVYMYITIRSMHFADHRDITYWRPHQCPRFLQQRVLSVRRIYFREREQHNSQRYRLRS